MANSQVTPEVSLFRPDLGNQPTFFHHAHHGSSQIDYILSNRNNLSKKYSILDKSYANTSAHCAVILHTNISIPLLVRNTNQKKTIKTKVLWEQRDEEKYRETILNELLQKDLPTLDIDKQIDIISNSLLNAQQQSIPSKITQLKGPKWKATPEVTVLLRMCKVIYNKWADLGKPIGHPLSLELKIHKKKLRQRQRMEQAIDRNTIHNKIMNTSSSQMFHRLIRRNLGDNSQSAINCIKTDENEYLFLAKDQRKAFANYYEDLSAPKPEQFDDLYVNLCKIRQKEMLKTLEDQEIPSDYFTSADIIKAIEELNMNKSPDEFGLCAEHLKFSKNEIAPYLTKLFNNIIETLKTPGTFKTGILFPIISKQLSKQIYPVCDTELNIRSQIKDLKTEQDGVQMVDEFARHAKIQRKIDKLLTQVKQQTSDRNNKCTMVGFAVQIGIYVLHALVMISLMISYRQEPLLQFQPEWFYPLQKIVAFPQVSQNDVLVPQDWCSKNPCAIDCSEKK
ncbi:GET1 [Mytilus edulis]|uniref:Guided entry of tail-anchored proteins factor 1 n=1 Tax=Mytilus edulis TaxID=6550 RepID=A0A8S3S3F8_MYTED|nr:GET1 [Mytilus edulis]